MIAFLVLGTAIASYIVYNNRVRRQLASTPASEETPSGVSDSEIVSEGEDDPESEENNGDDESPYDTLRYGR